MKKYLAVLLFLLTAQASAESYICKQVGYVNDRTGKYVPRGGEIFLTVVPENKTSVIITRIDKKNKVKMSFSLKEVRKNTTDVEGDSLVILISDTLDEPVRARLIGPHREQNDSVSSVVDLGTESFIKTHKTYEERYYCLREEEVLEKL